MFIQSGAVPVKTVVLLNGTHLNLRAECEFNRPTVPAALYLYVFFGTDVPAAPFMKNGSMLLHENESFLDKKQRIREEVRYKRHLISEDHGNEYADMILTRFLKTVPLMPQSVISSYWPIRSEVNVTFLTEKLILSGHTLALPAIADDYQNITFRRYRLNDPITMGPFRIPQPFDTAEEVNPSLIIIPMLGFSRDGHRLGYGKGFYDQLLGRIRKERPITAVGIAFSEQELFDFPYEEHDQTMDWIVTERECFRISK